MSGATYLKWYMKNGCEQNIFIFYPDKISQREIKIKSILTVYCTQVPIQLSRSTHFHVQSGIRSH